MFDKQRFAIDEPMTLVMHKYTILRLIKRESLHFSCVLLLPTNTSIHFSKYIFALKERMSEDISSYSWQNFVYKFNGKVENSPKIFICISIACTLIKVSTIATLSLLSVHHIIMGPWSSYLRNNTVIRQNKVKTTGKTILDF